MSTGSLFRREMISSTSPLLLGERSQWSNYKAFLRTLISLLTVARACKAALEHDLHAAPEVQSDFRTTGLVRLQQTELTSKS